MTLKFTGYAPIKPPVPQTNRTGCIADFMGGYYGLFGIEYESGNPERFFKRVNVVHGDNPAEVLATSRDEQIWQAHPDWSAPSGRYSQSNFTAAVTVREGLVAYVTNVQAGYGAVIGSLRWDGSDVHWGPETLVVDEDSLPEWEHTSGLLRVGFNSIKFPGEEHGQFAGVIALGAYQGRVLYVGGGRDYSTGMNYLVMRWFRFNADGRAAPDGDWIYKLGVKVNYDTGFGGGPLGVQGKFLYISSTYSPDEWYVMRINMETMAIKEIKLANYSNMFLGVTIGATSRGVEIPANPEAWSDESRAGGSHLFSIAPTGDATMKSKKKEFDAMAQRLGIPDYLTATTSENQFIPQTALLRPRREMIRLTYLPPISEYYPGPGAGSPQGFMLYTVDGQEVAEWRSGEISYQPGSPQLYVGTTHAIVTLNYEDPGVWFFDYPSIGNLAAGEMRSEGFFA